MPQKLGFRIKHGRCELDVKELPDLDEAKRLWMEGKSAQYILEQTKRKAKKQSD